MSVVRACWIQGHVWFLGGCPRLQQPSECATALLKVRQPVVLLLLRHRHLPYYSQSISAKKPLSSPPPATLSGCHLSKMDAAYDLVAFQLAREERRYIISSASWSEAYNLGR